MKPYFSFLLRFWQAGTPENPLWAASLEAPHTHEVIYFQTLQSLFDHVHHLAEESTHTSPKPTNSSTPNKP